VETGS
jgi:hypothetical protein